jgi:hypothetical protein
MHRIQSSCENREPRGVHQPQKRARPLRSSDEANDSDLESELQKVLSPYWAARSESAIRTY